MGTLSIRLLQFKDVYSTNTIAMALSDETKDRINAAIGVGKVS